MPAGVSWGEYLKVAAAAYMAMFVGAQTVHVFYKPLAVGITYLGWAKITFRKILRLK